MTSSLAQFAHASLGDSVSSVDVDRKAMVAKRGATHSYSNYRVLEIHSGSTSVREYVSSSGQIFGVAWSGRAHPDLNQLLGKYLSDYQTASALTPRERGRKPRLVRGSSVVVRTWGHMRNLQGHAYDPSLFPSGVSANDIQ
jgi:hypothetical protein